MNWTTLGEIVISFFKVGLLTFGGGYAMIPIAEKEVVEKRQWITQEELMSYYGLAQLSMGIIAINTCALIGYRVQGKIGAFVAGISSTLPSIIIITLIAMFFQTIMNVPIVPVIFSSIRIVVFALVLSTSVKFYKNGVKDIYGLILFSSAFVLITFVNVNPIFVIVTSGLLGMALYPYRKVK
jgi:chromate transporter